MVWPTSTIPTYGRGVWLECNGQSFSRTQFPQLYESLGTTRVPDYRGVFLRGYGSQSGYSSGSLGVLQRDATRDWSGLTTGLAKRGRSQPSHWGILENEQTSDYDIQLIYMHDAPYTYRYSISCSIGEDGGDCSLDESKETFPTVPHATFTQYWDPSIELPIANEIRPANIAVKFMIKAK